MTGASYDSPNAWALIDSGLKDSLILQTVSNLECVICLDVMHVPFLCSCGHSFCFGCLRSWLKNKLNCPTCRSKLKDPPVLNIQLRDVSKALTEMFMDSLEDGDAKQSLKDARETQTHEYERAAKAKRDLFGDSFALVVTLLDSSDGVLRCGNCHWEAHGSVCFNCGEPIRDPREDGYFDSDDGDAYDEDQEELELYGRHPDEYASDDSFIDSRAIEDIQQDLSSPELWELDGDQETGSWNGFRSDSEMYRNNDNVADMLDSEDEHPLGYSSRRGQSGRRGHRQPASIEVASDSESGSLIEMHLSGANQDLERAVDRLHRNHLTEVDSDDDVEILSRSTGRSRGHHRAHFSDDDSM